jgi:hypothetical protein
MDCPKCKAKLARERRTWFCERCESVFDLDGTLLLSGEKSGIKAPVPEPPNPSALEILILGLPHPLALLLNEYAKEENLYIKLHRMCDAAEMLIKFLAGIALAEVARCCKGGIAAAWGGKLRRLVIQNIRHPTFGQWLGLVKGALEALKEIPIPDLVVANFRELAEHVSQVIDPPRGTDENSILSLRNKIAHDSRLPNEVVPRYLKEFGHKARFEALWTENLGENMTGLDLLALTSEEQWISLKGPLFRFKPVSASESPELLATVRRRPRPGALYLTRRGAPDALELFPLQVYDLVRRRANGQLETMDPNRPAVQIYTCSDDHFVPRYIALHPEFTGSDGDESLREGFAEFFPLKDWSEKEAEELEKKRIGEKIIADAKMYHFRDIQNRYKEDPFVGRGRHLDVALKWLESCESGGASDLGLRAPDRRCDGPSAKLCL